MKIACFLVMLFVFNSHLPCLAQKTFERDLATYKENVEKKIAVIIKNEQFNGRGPIKVFIEALPYCIFKPEIKNNKGLTRFFIFIDTSFKMVNDSFTMTNQLIYWKDTLFSLPTPRMAGDSIFTNIEYPDIRWLNHYIYMIQIAQKYSTRYFYLKLLRRDAEWSVPIAFMDHGVIRLIDWDLNIYSNIKEFVEKKYGSVDKYLEMWEDDEDRRKLARHMSADAAKACFRNDYELWWRHYHTDSLRILNLFLNQVDSIVKMAPEQRKLLESVIRSRIGGYPECGCSNGVVLFGRDVSSLILNVLTYEQYRNFIKKRSDLLWLRGRAMDRLNYYYLYERKIPIEKEDEILNEEVFGQSDSDVPSKN